MNNSEARVILQVYRPGGEDASDPLMAAALAQARQDPELQAWLAAERSLDLRLQGKLRAELAVPPDLKASLLALPRIDQEKSRWRQPAWLAMAAAVALVLGLSAVWLRPTGPAPLDSFRQAMVGYSFQSHEHVVFKAPALAQIQPWLQSQGMNADFVLPSGLRGRPANGCKVVDWHGRKVALVCFTLRGGQHVDFFVLDAAALPGLPAGGAVSFAQAGAEMTAAWSRGGRVYLLAGGGDQRLLASLLSDS